MGNRLARLLRLEHWQLVRIYLIVYDVLAVNASYLLALWLRFDCQFSSIDPLYLEAWQTFTPFYTVACLAVFWVLRLYKSIWRFASFSELSRVVLSSAITAIFHTAAITMFVRRMPISYYIMGAVFQFGLVLGIRFSYRLLNMLRTSWRSASQGDRVMLVGAGQAGQMILRDMMRSREVRDTVVCIIDDNKNKWGRTVEGVTVVGGREDILSAVEKYRVDKIYVALPSATAEERGKILDICKETGCVLKNLPGIYQFVTGSVDVSAMQDVELSDLLGREPITVDMEEIYEVLRDKVILVTGGGGSIGSELCRQVAAHQPRKLIIFDIYENNAYAIENELRRKYPEMDLTVAIGSVRDTGKLLSVFSEYRPEMVFHAAAHKHVPLMEWSPCEAVKNNTLGTYKTAYLAAACGTRRFVLISTDKAVHPVNVMGASKRLCEMVIQTFARRIAAGQGDRIPAPPGTELPPIPADCRTEFAAVRFGNVLGSNGSVIPLFKEQIARGGPVTVTHPDIIRYFMTIPEAVSLVLQAGVYAGGGEIFVFDMGEPVKIDTLARNLIKLSGLKPEEDIPIVYTGLRPGEKLYEEKLMDEEGLRTTPNRLIHIASPIDFDGDRFLRELETLVRLAEANDDAGVRQQLRDMGALEDCQSEEMTAGQRT